MCPKVGDIVSGQDYSLGIPIEWDGAPYPLLRYVLWHQPAGVALEFGVGEGVSTKFIIGQMPVVGFDSFRGLPEDWRDEFPKGSFDRGGMPPQISGPRFIVGEFASTVPEFDFSSLGYIGLVHLDADLYSSTATALWGIAPFLKPGCFLVFDEWHGYPGAQAHEQRAWREIADGFEFTWTVVGHCGQEWAIRITE